MTACLASPPNWLAPEELAVDAFDSFESAGVEREGWDRFVDGVGGDLYATYDWCRIWWRHYGERRSLRLYVFRRGRTLVGLAPMFIDDVRLGPTKLRIAKRVGVESALALSSMPFSIDSAEAMYRMLIAKLFEHEHCGAVCFGVFSGEDPTIGSLRAACASLGATVVRDAPAGVHTLFRLPDRFETYVSGLARSQRQNWVRQSKLLKKGFRVEHDVVTAPSACHQAFADFKSLHERQWRSEGKLGHFGDWPRSEAFNADLVNELAGLGRLRMHRIIADGTVIALQYSFVFGGCCYWRLTARAVDPAFERFGLGVLGLVDLIESMIGEGVRRIEGGVGHYNYKLRFGGKELEHRSFVVANARPATVRRTRLFLKLSDWLHLLYYRGWYLRLAPRLRLPRRPLWRIWARSRL